MRDQSYLDFIYEIRIAEGQIATQDLDNTYQALQWIYDNNYKNGYDFLIDIHRGRLGYASFYFHNKELATEFALIFK